MKYVVSMINSKDKLLKQSTYTSLEKAKNLSRTILNCYKKSDLIKGVNIRIENGCTLLEKRYSENFWRDYRR